MALIGTIILATIIGVNVHTTTYVTKELKLVHVVSTVKKKIFMVPNWVCVPGVLF